MHAVKWSRIPDRQAGIRHAARQFLALCLCTASAASIGAQPLGLLDLYEQVLANNPTLKGSEYSVDQAEARKDGARSSLLPQVSGTGSLSWNRLDQTVTNPFTQDESVVRSEYRGARAVFQARQALFDLPAYFRWQSTKSSIRQAEQDMVVTRMSLASDLVDRYMKVLQAEDELTYVRGEQELTAAELQRVRRMVEMQLVLVKDVYEVEAYALSLQTKELEIRNARSIALEQLRELAGIDVPDVAALQATALPPVPGEMEQWVADARQHHPVLAALQHAVDAAGQSLSEAKAKHLPRLSLLVSETYADNGGFDNRQLEPYTVGSLGLQLNMPIYSGGGVDAGVREAVANREITETQRLEKVLHVERNTRTAYLDATTARARIDSLAKEVQAREKAREAQQKSYEIGLATVVDALEAKKNLMKARFDHAAARYDYVRALVTLRLWAGTLSERDLAEIDGWLEAH